VAHSRRLAAWSFGLSILQSLALIPIALLVRQAFDEAIPNEDKGQLLLLASAILGLYLAALAIGLAGRYAVLRVTKPAVAGIRSELMEHVIWLPTSFHDSADGARLHSLVVQDTERLDVMAKALLAIVIPSLGTAALLLAALAVVQPVLLAIVAVTLAALVGLHRILRRTLHERLASWQETSDSFSAEALGAIASFRLIKARNAEELEIAAVATRAEELGGAGMRLGWVQNATALAQVAIGGVAGVVVLLAGGIAVIDGSMSLGDLIAFLAVMALARGQLNWVVSALPDVQKGAAAVERIDDVLSRTDPQPYSGTREIVVAGAISLDRVTFGYTRAEAPVLSSVSLTLEPGEWVAVLGPTGAGKTTLAALLLGLYRPWEGSVLVDGIPLDEIEVRGLRRQLGVLLQEDGVRDWSVSENISLGRPEATAAEIEAAARLSTADDFIGGLPAGYGTRIGDGGQQLSSGQRQRIALARAVLGSPPLLILDEPTSHLDPPTAGRVLDNLETLEPRPTLILITHDPLVAERADRVVEVRGGQLTEVEARVTAPAR
jgi:ABC-type bacteriocin/lantibiotic exporter with double-glycine peptidase domain